MKLYLIYGKARHGKDTLAGYMKSYYEQTGKKTTILQLAAPLKSLIHNHFGWDEQEQTKPRELMQYLGTDIIRHKLQKDDYFINRAIEDIDILSHFFDVIIISDIRFPKEIEKISDKFFQAVVIHILRTDLENSGLTDQEKKHISEIALDNYHDYDYEIINTTLSELEKSAKEVIRKEEVKDEKFDK